MAWYNPMDWARGAVSVGYTGAGYVARPFSKDYAEFLWTAGNPTYVGQAYAKPAGKTAAERKAESLEAHRFTKRVVEEIEPDIESAAVTGAQGLGLVYGGPLGAVAVEAITDAALAAKGEAPTRSLAKRYSPFGQNSDYGTVGNFLVDMSLIGRRDDHYANGGLPDQHPERLAYLKSFNPPSKPLTFWERVTESVGGIFSYLTQKTGLSFGFGSLVAAVIGAIAMVFNPVVGGALLVGGALFGQTIVNKITSGNPAIDEPPVLAASTPVSQPTTSSQISVSNEPEVVAHSNIQTRSKTVNVRE